VKSLVSTITPERRSSLRRIPFLTLLFCLPILAAAAGCQQKEEDAPRQKEEDALLPPDQVVTVTVDRTLSPREALDRASRRQIIDSHVVAAMPGSSGSVEEVEVVFFTLRRQVTNDELAKEYDSRGLMPADPYVLAAVNASDRSFAAELPNGTHWRSTDGEWCFAAFHHGSDGEHYAHVYRHDIGWWHESRWFAGVRKQAKASSQAASASIDLSSSFRSTTPSRVRAGRGLCVLSEKKGWHTLALILWRNAPCWVYFSYPLKAKSYNLKAILMTRIAINGFGRIGRSFLKRAQKYSDLEIVAINDLGNVGNLAYLLAYDTVYGRSGLDVSVDGQTLVVDGKAIPVLQEKDPANLPWKKFDVDVVVESTGFFTHIADAKKHLDAGAKKVVITAPAKGEPIPGVESATILLGVNEDKFKTCDITSNASCTTNAASPVIQVLHEALGIEKALLNTAHGYTASQNLQDGPKKDWREGRAAAGNIVPTSTGAAIAVTKAISELEGKFDGIALRVPVIVGSVADITFIAKRDTTVEEVNDILRKASATERWQGILKVSDEELVSSDIIGEPYGAIVDSRMTRVVDGNLVKVLSWYDNEMGYSHTLVEHVRKLAQHI
jgi:glyceraldehyde 3-phosphate dehydrogenase